MRVALALEYNGMHYNGWQSQPSGTTVQDVFEAALAAFAGVSSEPIRVICAGRTDTGVHATGQVVHFDTSLERPREAWVRGVNAHLPQDVRVLWAHVLPAEHETTFHARFAATARRYRYVLLNRPVAPAIDAGRLGWFHAPLDVSRMQAAADLLLGEHDFSSFRSSECQAKSPVKQLYRLDVSRTGPLVLFDVEASAFLHHMVRNIVGSLVYVGAGRNDIDWFRELLAARDRSRAAPTFAPDGLYLSAVTYDAKFGLPTCEAGTLDAFVAARIQAS